MDKLFAYWRYVWVRLMNPYDETKQVRQPGETNDQHIARLPITRKRLIWQQDGTSAVEVVRYVESTGTYITSYHYSDGRVSHHYGKAKAPRNKHGQRNRSLSSRQVRRGG